MVFKNYALKTAIIFGTFSNLATCMVHKMGVEFYLVVKNTQFEGGIKP
jgi:hypothetical protein